jgi:hypothetical protein
MAAAGPAVFRHPHFRPERHQCVFRGEAEKVFPRFQISLSDLSGQLVLGSSSAHPDSWSGEIHDVALYSRELTPREVVESYRPLSGTEWFRAPLNC